MSKSTKPITWKKFLHPDDYDGCPFLTLITPVRRASTKSFELPPFVAIIDNVTPTHLVYYNLDLLLEQEQQFYHIALEWYEDGHTLPLSYYLSNKQLTSTYQHCYHSLPLIGVGSTIGPLYQIDTDQPIETKRRKIKRTDQRELHKYEFK